MRFHFVTSSVLGLALAVSAALGTTTSAGAFQIWTPGASAPTVIVRGQGAWFAANNRFYALGGRASDAAGSDLINPREYNPATNSWSVKVAAFPSLEVCNMVGGVLTDAGVPYIYSVGGSAAGAATSTATVKRYDPVADVITIVATDPWPAPVNTLCGGGAVVGNKLYILGGFSIGVGMTNQIWEFDPASAAGARWTLKAAVLPAQLGYVPTAVVGGLIYTAGGATFSGGALFDDVNSSVYDPATDILAAIAPITRATGETRAVNQGGSVWVLGGGRTLPNPSNQVDAYAPGTNTWSLAPSFVLPRRNIAADIDPATGTIFMVGGYAGAAPGTASNNMEIYRIFSYPGFCSGDGSGTACPCGNSGSAGNGCANSIVATGGHIAGSGFSRLSADTLVLSGTGMPNSSALYFQGTTQAGAGLGLVFGDGLRCAGGAVTRLGTKVNVANASQYPEGGDLSVSVRGLVTTSGTRTYQIWYRNAASFCTVDTFNLSNGLTATWVP